MLFLTQEQEFFIKNMLLVYKTHLIVDIAIC